MKKMFVLLVLFAAVAGNAVAAPDYEKEQRWREQVADAILDGEEVTIDGADKPFFAIFTEAEEASERAAIVIHGSGVHPDWPTVVQPLRIGLTAHGYNTLSLQMPVLPNETELEEYVELFPLAGGRIAAGVRYLQENGYTAEVIIAHSLGSAMSAHYLATNADAPVRHFVGIGMPDLVLPHLPAIKVDTLDLYGTEDFPGIIASAPARKAAAAGGADYGENYTQQILQGDHFFTDQDDALLQAVADWLAR